MLQIQTSRKYNIFKLIARIVHKNNWTVCVEYTYYAVLVLFEYSSGLFNLFVQVASVTGYTVVINFAVKFGPEPEFVNG